MPHSPLFLLSLSDVHKLSHATGLERRVASAGDPDSKSQEQLTS